MSDRGPLDSDMETSGAQFLRWMVRSQRWPESGSKERDSPPMSDILKDPKVLIASHCASPFLDDRTVLEGTTLTSLTCKLKIVSKTASALTWSSLCPVFSRDV